MKHFKNDDGMGIVTALMVAFVVFTLAGTWYALSVHELDEVGFDRHRRTAVNAAESGVREAMYLLAENVVIPGYTDGFREEAELPGGASFGATAGSCNLTSLETADGMAAGEYWVRSEETGDLRYLIEAWGFGPAVGARQAVEKKVVLEVELLPFGAGFTHALFAAESGLQSGNRKTIYGDVYSGKDVIFSNLTQVYANDAGYPGVGNLTAAGDLVVTGGSNTSIVGSVYVNGFIRDNRGTPFAGDIVTRYDNPASSYTASYFKNGASVGGTLYVAGSALEGGSNISGNVVFNANNWDPFPTISVPQFVWNSDATDPFTTVIYHATPAAFLTWFSAHNSAGEGGLFGAHYVEGDVSIDFTSSYFSDSFLVAAAGNINANGKASGGDSVKYPIWVALIVDNAAKRLTMGNNFGSEAGKIHHLLVSEGEINAANQTIIYGSVNGNADVSANRLEVHYRPPTGQVVAGFEFDPDLADTYIPQPLVWREVATDEGGAVTDYCTP